MIILKGNMFNVCNERHETVDSDVRIFRYSSCIAEKEKTKKNRRVPLTHLPENPHQ